MAYTALKRPVMTFVLLLCLLVLAISPALAQTPLSDGSTQQGSITADAPLALYSFSGNAGELVDVRVLSLTPGLTPSLSVNSPTQQQLAVSSNDPLLGGRSAAHVSYVLQESGVHFAFVSAANNGTGDFLILFDVTPPSVSTNLAPGNAIEVTLPPGAPPQQYVFTTSDAANTLVVGSNTADFAYTATVRNLDRGGQVIGIINSRELEQTRFVLPAGGRYQVTVGSTDNANTGNVFVQLSAGILSTPTDSDTTTQPDTPPATAAPVVPPPATTEEASAPDGPSTTTTTSNVCTATVTSVANIRSGPGTGYRIVGARLEDDIITITGFYNNWYTIVASETSNGQAWIWSSLVRLDNLAPCDALPRIEPPELIAPAATSTPAPTNTIPAPATTEEASDTGSSGGSQPTATYTATPTYTMTATTASGGGGTNPTATYTPSYTPTMAATATYTPSYTPTNTATATYTPSYTPTTPPAAQVAPEDARFVAPLEIPLDNTASSLDFVSYPEGDTEDRIRWDISGMSQTATSSGGRARLVIAASCFGDGTQHITFFVGGNTYQCGQTIVDREVTYDSRTGSVIITATGGTGTYVQWVLTGTATHIN